MFNLFSAFVCAICGAAIIIQYGKDCAVTRKHRFNFHVVLACFDLLVAGVNIARFINGG